MKRKIILIGIPLAALAILGGYIALHRSAGYQFVSVTRGAITQTVSITGNTTPVDSLNLAFQNGGTIAAVYKNAGDTVNTGDLIARLDTSDLNAQLSQAQASILAQQAKLQGLQAGSTPQNIQVAETAVTSAQQSLTNTYASITDTLTASFAKANDAIRNQIAPLFSNAESNNPQLTFTISDNQVMNTANFQRIQTSAELNAWQSELNMLNSTTATSSLLQALAKASSHLSVISNLLTTISTAIVDQINLSASTAAAYKTAVANAVTEINSAASSINTLNQTIASENVAITQAQAQLSVTLAGATPQDIAAQQAAVAQAQASAQQIQVKINQASLISPIAGTVTTQNAKAGQIAGAGQIMTSIISSSNLEIDANIPETDIGKVALNDAVDMTFDAFPGEKFTGKVFYVNPGETLVSGVVEYQVKISFDKIDPRMKSGLTANLTIKTQTNQNTLILPQYAVIQNASGSFVEVLDANGSTKELPVTLGLRDQNGNVEITGGVSEHQQVVNIGLKTQ